MHEKMLQGLPHPITWFAWGLICCLSLQEKLQVALGELRRKQELAEKLEVEIAMKRADWKARMTS